MFGIFTDITIFNATVPKKMNTFLSDQIIIRPDKH